MIDPLAYKVVHRPGDAPGSWSTDILYTWAWPSGPLAYYATRLPYLVGPVELGNIVGRFRRDRNGERAP